MVYTTVLETCEALTSAVLLIELPAPGGTSTVLLTEILPPGLDDYLIEQSARLGCIGCPTTDCDIDIRPPL